MRRDAGTPQAGARERPFTELAAHGFQYAFIDQFDDTFYAHGTGAAEFIQRQGRGFIQYEAVNHRFLLLAHDGLHPQSAAWIERQFLLHRAV